MSDMVRDAEAHIDSLEGIRYIRVK